jgi:thiol:disulfide interchange protein DsbD
MANLVSASDTVTPGQPVTVGLRLHMAPGWHTYWRNPGDAGVATDVALAPASGTAGPLQWPAPSRFSEGTLTTFGYTGDLLLPFTVTPSAAPAALQVHASWLVCRDVCVPEEADLALNLAAGPPAPSAQAPLFDAAAALIPVPAPFAATLSPTGVLALSGAGLPADVASAEFFPTGDGMTEAAGAQQPVRQGGELRLPLKLSAPDKAPGPVSGVVELTNSHGQTTRYDLTAQPGPAEGDAGTVNTLPVLLLLALGGGLLLNLMPCVFPVLAMKAMALARMGGADRRTIRDEALSYTAGVVVAFVALGGGLVALRAAGQSVGWGFQLQSPVFVTVIAWLLFATGLNLSGVFAVGERFAGTGQSLATRRGHAGSFFTGLLAVVVATPCTASFMGAAMAGALAAPAPVATLVFAVMGLGLALPYACVALAPGLARLLPRPGAWMITLRQILAFPMYGAAAWLVWVTSQQAGPSGVLTAMAGLVAVGFAAWALGASQTSAGRWRVWGRAASAAAILLAAASLWPGGGSSAEPSEPFSAARLAELRNQGRPVFVNMTAAWCISCLVNERLALSPQAVQRAFTQDHVAYLKGDWTRQDPAISSFLRDHGRDGVPLYVYYAPGRPPAILPQLLTEGTVLQQLAGSPASGG